jgi:predicted nucleic acid-binding protein
MIVADTNLIVYLLLPGNHTDEVQNFYLREPHWAAPILWRSELINVLVTYFRAGRLNVELCEQLMEQAEHIMRGRSYMVDSTKVLAVAARSGCSGYDSEFIALAEELELPLVTFNEKILQRCRPVARKPWQ